jgi:hypothetical protein
VTAAVATGLVVVVDGRTIPSAAAYSVVYVAAAGAALVATAIAAITLRGVARSAVAADLSPAQ